MIDGAHYPFNNLKTKCNYTMPPTGYEEFVESDVAWINSEKINSTKEFMYSDLTPWPETRSTLLLPGMISPEDNRNNNFFIRSEVDLSKAPSSIGTIKPWIQNTFFHFPTATASAESHPVPRSPSTVCPTSRGLETPGTALSTSSLAEHEIGDWSSPKVSDIELHSSFNTMDYRQYNRGNNATHLDNTLTATFEALEHIGCAKETDTMLTVFLQDLARGSQTNDKQSKNAEGDPQIQAQDALLNYCKTLIECGGNDSDTTSEENEEDSEPKVTKPIITTVKPSTQNKENYLINNNNIGTTTGYSHWVPSKETSSIAAVSPSSVMANEGSSSLQQQNSVSSGNSSNEQSNTTSTTITVFENNKAAVPTVNLTSSTPSLDHGIDLRITEPQHFPPQELSEMSLLYQRPDVQSRRVAMSRMDSHNTKQGSGEWQSHPQGPNPHPNTCKPCAFYWTKGCVNGQGCQFCHEWHAPKKKKPMKDQKNLMIIARPDGKIEFLRCSIDEALRRS